MRFRFVAFIIGITYFVVTNSISLPCCDWSTTNHLISKRSMFQSKKMNDKIKLSCTKDEHDRSIINCKFLQKRKKLKSSKHTKKDIYTKEKKGKSAIVSDLKVASSSVKKREQLSKHFPKLALLLSDISFLHNIRNLIKETFLDVSKSKDQEEVKKVKTIKETLVKDTRELLKLFPYYSQLIQSITRHSKLNESDKQHTKEDHPDTRLISSTDKKENPISELSEVSGVFRVQNPKVSSSPAISLGYIRKKLLKKHKDYIKKTKHYSQTSYQSEQKQDRFISRKYTNLSDSEKFSLHYDIQDTSKNDLARDKDLKHSKVRSKTERNSPINEKSRDVHFVDLNKPIPIDFNNFLKSRPAPSTISLNSLHINHSQKISGFNKQINMFSNGTAVFYSYEKLSTPALLSTPLVSTPLVSTMPLLTPLTSTMVKSLALLQSPIKATQTTTSTRILKDYLTDIFDGNYKENSMKTIAETFKNEISKDSIQNVLAHHILSNSAVMYELSTKIISSFSIVSLPLSAKSELLSSSLVSRVMSSSFTRKQLISSTVVFHRTTPMSIMDELILSENIDTRSISPTPSSKLNTSSESFFKSISKTPNRSSPLAVLEDKEKILRIKGKNFQIQFDIPVYFKAALGHRKTMLYRELKNLVENSIKTIYKGVSTFSDSKLTSFSNNNNNMTTAMIEIYFNTREANHLKQLYEGIASGHMAHLKTATLIRDISLLNDNIRDIRWCLPPCMNPYGCFPSCEDQCCALPPTMNNKKIPFYAVYNYIFTPDVVTDKKGSLRSTSSIYSERFDKL